MKPEYDTISILNVPTDIGTNRTGASLGPYALKAMGLCQKLARLGFDVKEIDNISGPGNTSDFKTGQEKLEDASIWYRSVKYNVYRSLQCGFFPLIIGGDHSISIGSIAAVARYCETVNQPLSVLWFDAHTDFNTFDTTPSGNIHGMPAAVISGLGHPSLLSIGHKTQLVEPENIYQVGVRSIDTAEQQTLSASKVQVFDMRLIDEKSLCRVIGQILAELQEKKGWLHVSFDVDCLDPMIAPGTGTKIPGGLNYREAQLCMEMIHESGLMKSLDIVELNPLYDILNQTGEVLMELIESLFGKQTLPVRNLNQPVHGAYSLKLPITE